MMLARSVPGAPLGSAERGAERGGARPEAGLAARLEQRAEGAVGERPDAAGAFGVQRYLRQVLDELEAQVGLLDVGAPGHGAVVAEQDRVVARDEAGEGGAGGG